MKKLALLLLFSSCLFIRSSLAQATAPAESAVLNHIAVYVSDLNRSGNFYEQLFKLKKLQEPFKDGKHIWFSLGPAGQLHLISGAHAGSMYDKNEHICFSVASITDFIQILDSAGISYENWAGTAKAPTVRVDRVNQIYFRDPDGHWLEVNDQKRFN